EATAEELVDVLERKRVRAYEPGHVRAETRRIAQPPHRRGRELCTAVRMPAVRPGLPEIMEERAEPNREGRARIGRSLHDRKDVLVERQMLAVAVLLEPDRRLELGEESGEDACVAGQPQCSRRLSPEQELGQLAQAVGVKPPPHP